MSDLGIEDDFTPNEDDDLLMVEDVDVADDSKLREVITMIERMLGSKHSLRLSILTFDQWQKVVARSVPASLRSAAEKNLHLLQDRHDRQHLYISLSCVQGINTGDRVIYGEVVYAVLRAYPSALPIPLLRGVNDLLAEHCGKQLGVNIYTRRHYEEAELMKQLAIVMAHEFKYSPLDWLLLARRNPERFFLAVRRSEFSRLWLERAKENAELAEELSSYGNKRAALVEMLSRETMRPGDTIFTVTAAVAAEQCAIVKASRSKAK